MPLLKKLCLQKSKLSFFKTIAMIILAALTWSHAVRKNDEFESEFRIGLQKPVRTNFHIYMMIYALQYIIVPVFHAIFFVIFGFLTCCCTFWDKEVDHDFNYDKELWSNNFVEYELGQLHNFEYHPRGRQELQFNRNLDFVQR